MEKCNLCGYFLRHIGVEIKSKYMRKLTTYLAILTLLIIVYALFVNYKSDNTIESQLDSIYIKVETDLFEEAVQIIKDHEGWHSKKHYPYIGYGHKILKGEKLDHNISEDFATELVRKDLRQKCELFREFGKDSLLLGVLAYNIGEYKLINQDGSPKALLVKKLKAGDRDIYDEYISFRIAWNRIIPSIEKRRITEFNTLYDKTKINVTRRRSSYNN